MESIFKAREPSVDGLEAEPKSGGQQASPEECIFKTCILQGFGNIPFFILTSSQLFFHFCQDQLITTVSIMNYVVLLGPWYLKSRSPVTSHQDHDKVQQNLLPGTAWAAELPPAVDLEPETPRLPSSSVHISLMMIYLEDNSCLTPHLLPIPIPL